MKSIKKFLPLLLISGAIAVYFLINRKTTPGAASGGGGGGLFGNLLSGSTPPPPNTGGNNPQNVSSDEIKDLIKIVAPKSLGGQDRAILRNGDPLQKAWQDFFDKHHPLSTTT